MKNTRSSADRSTPLTRRTMLRTAVAAGAVPLLVPASALGLAGRSVPSERVTIGFIGCGKMCNGYHLPEILKQPDTQAVAVCEVDRTRREHARKRGPSQRSQSSPGSMGSSGRSHNLLGSPTPTVTRSIRPSRPLRTISTASRKGPNTFDRC